MRRPVAGSSSTNIHMLGATTPAIGPTASWWWQGCIVAAPDSKSAGASSGCSTSPSSTAAPISAPRIGPEARSQVSGGPACRNRPRSSPSASAAGSTSTSTAVVSMTACTARASAWARSGSSASVARSVSVPGIGGRQSTRCTPTAWASMASPSRPTPTVTTLIVLLR